MLTLSVLVSAVAFSACGNDPSGSVLSTNSLSAPFYRHLSVPRYTPFEPCAINDTNKNPKVTAYLHELLDHLSRGNKAISGYFSTGNFCLGLANGEVMNATAFSNAGTVLVTKAVFEKLDPVSILALLAHEVGHVLLRHGESPPLPEVALLNDESYNQIWLKQAQIAKTTRLGHAKKIRRVSQRLLELGQKDLSVRAEFLATQSHNYAVEIAMRSGDFSIQPESYRFSVIPDDDFLETISGHSDSQVKSLMEEPLLPPNQAMEYQTLREDLEIYVEKVSPSANEEQADAAGLILFVNAGFSVRQYEAFFEQMLALDHGEAAKDKCLKMVSSDQEPPKFSAFSSKSHPSMCWRLFNVRHRLKPVLEAEKPMLAETPDGSLPTGISLQDVQGTL